MEELLLSRAYLESLTNNDLFRIADGLGIDVPDDPDRCSLRASLIEELLEFNSDGSCGFGESEINKLILTETVPLPKHYNITFIEVMIRDPLWAFVFWEIKASDKEQFEKAQDFDGYYLKVSRINGAENSSGHEKEELYTVSVKPEDTAWYLSLSPDSEDNILWPEQSQFMVEFCVKLGGVETVLAESNSVKNPGMPDLTSAAVENPLARLSGYEDFHVLRKKERQSRIKKSEGELQNGSS